MMTYTALFGLRRAPRLLVILLGLVLVLIPALPLRAAPPVAPAPQTVGAALAPVAALALGSHHSCALTRDRTVLCWGRNGQGQLGDGTTAQRTAPTPVPGLGTEVAALTAGEGHTCVLTTAGAVRCWGANADGELGDGTTTGRLKPTPVSGLGSGVRAIGAGARHTCALKTTGAVVCWGRNSNGQVGDGTTTNRSAPVAVSGLGSGVTSIAVGGFHTCALTSAGGVRCWGRNGGGQLGDNTRTQRLAPVAVNGLASGVQAIEAGTSHSCVRRSGGLLCWGYNDYGQIGDGTLISRLKPVSVSGLASGVQAIAGGGNHSCALTSGGAVRCWGNNVAGQVGDGTQTRRVKPVNVSGLASGVASVATGYDHSCALTTAGAVWCWGHNLYGQLGDGTTTDRLTPVGVTGRPITIAAVSVGLFHSCALTTQGGVKCWGSNGYGQLGDGTQQTYRVTPVDVVGLQSGVRAIAAGIWHTCALTTQGGVKCWGQNLYGQLGDGTISYDDQSTPVDVVGLQSGVQTIATNGNHTCALTMAGGVKCWGLNEGGALGDGTTTTRAAPVDVAGLQSGVTAIAGGGHHTCALTMAGGVKCWGLNQGGALGDGTTTNRTVPVDVVGLQSGVTAIAAGYFHTCALPTAGGLQCWGENLYGQVGDATQTSRVTPVDVVGLQSGVTAVAGGGYHTCALTTQGGAKCWGRNEDGQLGDGTSGDGDFRVTPVDVVGLQSGVTAIAAGSPHTCALTTQGGVKCWGQNLYGQLGDGTQTNRVTPVDVVF